MRRAWCAVALLLAFAGCRSSAPPTAAKTYELRGQVLDVRRDIHEIRIAHEEIPGYMAAMTMSFGVKNDQLLDGLTRGDRVRATLSVTDTDAWLSTIEKIGHDDIVEHRPESTYPATPALELLEPGQPVPAQAFVDQDNRPFSLDATRGRAVALTFIYTRCPLPTFCPRMDRNFLAAQKAVEARQDLRGRVQFVSVSFDPAYDTPKVLKQHATTIGANLASWRFVTAPPADVDRFAGRFGVSVIRDDKDPDSITHNLRTAVVGPDGRLVKVLSGGDWTPEDLVRDLAAALST